MPKKKYYEINNKNKHNSSTCQISRFSVFEFAYQVLISLFFPSEMKENSYQNNIFELNCILWIIVVMNYTFKVVGTPGIVSLHPLDCVFVRQKKLLCRNKIQSKMNNNDN